MYKHILIATDGSESATKAVTTGLLLAKMHGARATAITVSAPWPAARSCYGAAAVPFDAFERSAKDVTPPLCSPVSNLAKQLNVECEITRVRNYAAESLLQTAQKGGCDLIVIASHDRHGLSPLMGLHATHVLANSLVPVLICK